MSPILHRPGRCFAFAAIALAVSAPASTTPQVGALPAPSPRPHVAETIGGHHDRFIVRWSQHADPTSRRRALSTALHQVLPRAASATAPTLRLQPERRLAGGAWLVRATRPLRRGDAAMLVRVLAADPAITHVEPDRLLQHTGIIGPVAALPAGVPDDEFYADNQWHLFDPVGGIRAPEAWDSASGDGTVVAVLDTGITAHPDLDGNMLPGYDFITDPWVSRRDSDARAPGAQDRGDWNDDPEACAVRPSSWHGTHVAGTVAELTDNAIGMAGVAFDAQVLPVRVLGRCGGYTSDIADAIVWAAGGEVPGVPANATPAEVINLSLGGAGACATGSAMQAAIDQAVALGAVVVAAAGNDNADVAAYSPASCDHVITVGATRVNAARADYSNHGLRVDLAAPGGGGEIDGIYGYVFQAWREMAPTTPEQGSPWYVGMAGTSMAAPHVSGVAALVQGAVAQPLAPAQMRELLKLTARPFPAPTPEDTPLGAGILDAEAALAAALHPCTDCDPPAQALDNNVPVRNLDGAAGSTRLFSIKVPAGVTDLRLMSYGGTGDVALWIRHGAEPTATDADHRSDRLGNNEIVTIARPRYGTYYIKLVANEPYARVSLRAAY